MVTKEQLQELRSQTDELQKKLDSKLEAVPKKLPSGTPIKLHRFGLRLKADTDLFTDEEKAFFEEIEAVCKISMAYLSELADSIKQIQLERQTEQAYIGIIIPPELSLDGIEEETVSLYEETEELFQQLYEIRMYATATGWVRYITDQLTDYERIMDEAKAIVDGIEYVRFIEQKGIRLELPRVIRIEIDTPYYDAGGFQNLPHETSTSNGFFRTHTYYHRKALEEHGYPTAELDEYIEQRIQTLSFENVPVMEEDLPSISKLSTKPDNYYYPTDKFSRSLSSFKVGYNEKGEEIINEVKLESSEESKRGLQITGRVSFTYRNQEGTEVTFQADESFTDYDLLVMCAVYTVWENARIKNEIINGEVLTTLRNLYQIAFMGDNSNPTPEALEKLKNSLMKFATCYTRLDVSEEAKHHKNMGNFKSREGAFFNIVIDTYMVHGQVSDVVHIIRADTTPFLSYDKQTNRIGSAPYKKLSTPSINKNEETALIKHYLVERIGSKSKLSNTIVFDTIFENCNIREADFKNWKDKRAKSVRKVITILDDFKKNGLIKGYRINRKGHSAHYSVTITKQKEDNAET